MLVYTAGIFIMLLIMSFNVFVFFTLIAGLTVGKFLASKIELPNLETVGSLAQGSVVYCAKGDHCCQD